METNKYGRVAITTHSDSKHSILFKMRDIGKALRYTAGGANFTRLIGIKKSPWNVAMKMHKHYVRLPSNPEKGSGQRSNWLTPEGLRLAINLSALHHYKVKEVKKFAEWILSDHPDGETKPLYGFIKDLVAAINSGLIAVGTPKRRGRKPVKATAVKATAVKKAAKKTSKKPAEKVAKKAAKKAKKVAKKAEVAKPNGASQESQVSLFANVEPSPVS